VEVNETQSFIALTGPREIDGFETEWATVSGSHLSVPLFIFHLAECPFSDYVNLMKVKQSPDDFRVEELSSLTPGDAGTFAFYRLTKIDWTTPDALQLVRRKWSIDAQRLSFAGLKDRHAHTIQYFTIFDGPRRDYREKNLTVEYLGQVPDEVRSSDILANRFRLVLRDLAESRAEASASAFTEVGSVGVPNYFDDQRFGSVGDENEFIARLMVKEQYEDALKLLLAGRYAFDKLAVKREKVMILADWGDWPKLRAALPRGPAHSIVEHLVHNPTDFKGGLARFDPELMALYLSAWQSHLWNRMLTEWLKLRLPAEQLTELRLRMGSHAIPRSLDDVALNEWQNLKLPLPSSRLRWDDDATWAEPLRRVLAEEGMELSAIRLREFRKPFFSKGDRDASVIPSNVTHSIQADERHPKRKKLELGFDLPRGCYATMIVKRIVAG